MVLHGVYGGTAVFVPQVDGFGHNGIRVLLRYLRSEASVSCDIVAIRWQECLCRSLTLHRNPSTPSGRLMPINTIL